MIVRISGEGQFEVADDQRDALNELDNAAVAAVDAGDEAAFTDKWNALLAAVRGGRALDDDDLSGSDLILPPADISFEEAAEEFTGEGLIPD